MNNQGAIQCKVKLLADGEQQEMRRFQLDDSSFASNFELFREKLRAVFPQLRTAAFKVTWTDSDGDVITIGNDEDLLMAMMEMNGLKMLDVHLTTGTETKEDADEEIPFNVYGSVITCDVCNNRITRYRFKCLQCHDYDLCQACEQAGNHSHHAMMRLVNLEIPRGLHKMVSHCTRAARKAAHHAAREAHHAARSAHRISRCGFDLAAKAARGAAASASAGPGRCPFRQEEQHTSRQQVPDVPVFDTGVLFDLASSFLAPFTQAQGATAAANNGAQAQAQPQAQPQTEGQGQTNTGATPSQAESGTNTPTGSTTNQPQVAPSDVLGNILRDVFSAINANVTGASQAASGTTTPVPVPTSAQTPTATPATAAAPENDVVFVNQTKNNSTPMEVEPNQPAQPSQPSQPSQPANIYPNVPQAPDAGWTFVGGPTSGNSQPSAPVNPDELKYASQLGQLRRMGFSDNIDLLGLLKRYNGNIGQVVNHLFEHSN